MKGNHKSWNEYLPHIEFAYNKVVIRLLIFLHLRLYMVLILTLLWICYLFLIHMNLCIRKGLTKADFVKKLHERIKNKIQKQTGK